MELVALTLGTAILSAVLGAIVGAYLQKRWTPDLVPELASLQVHLAKFQERIETLESERVDASHLPIFISLELGEHSKYTLMVRNDSDEALIVQSVNTLYDGIAIAGAGRPTGPDDWKIGPRTTDKISWVPCHDPMGKIGAMFPHLAYGASIPIEFVLHCRIRGKPKALRQKLEVGVDRGNYKMWQTSPST
jgi:hypothetical protein